MKLYLAFGFKSTVLGSKFSTSTYCHCRQEDVKLCDVIEIYSKYAIIQYSTLIQTLNCFEYNIKFDIIKDLDLRKVREREKETY